MKNVIRSIGLILIFAGCSGEKTTVPDQLGNNQALPAARAIRLVKESALPHAPASVLWLGEVHTAAMQDVMDQIGTIQRMKKTEKCAKVAAITRKYFGRIQSEARMRDQEPLEHALGAALARVNCDPGIKFSVFSLPNPNLAAAQATGGFEAYESALYSAMHSGQYPGETAAALDAVVVSANDLSSEDFAILSGLAQIGASSAYYWYDVQVSRGYDGSYGGDIGPLVFSMTSVSMCGYWCKVGWADLAGALLGARWTLSLGGSLVGAVVFSATAAIILQ